MTSSSVTAQHTKSGVVVVSSCMAPEVLAAGRRGERGEQLPGPARAEHPAHHGGHHDQRGEPERGQHPQRDQGVPAERPRRARASSGVSGGWST